jgi:hypothetical protein
MKLSVGMLSFTGLLASTTPLAWSGGPEGICTPAKPSFGHAPVSPLAVGPMPGRPLIADMNADGQPDIVLACGTCCGSPASPESGHVVVLLNGGAGSFKESTVDRLKVGPSVRQIVVAHVNADGAPDVIAAEHDTYNITVLLNDGKGVLRLGGSYAAASGAKPHTLAIAAGDMNADGHIDAITTNANDNSISVMLGDGKGAFSPAPGSPFAAGRHPYDSIAIADLNGDKRLDIAMPLLAAGKLGVMFGDSAGALSEGPKMIVGARPGYLAIGDVNADGKHDLVSTHDDEGIIDIFLGDGAGKFAAATGSPLKLTTAVWGVTISDMNADTHADLVLGGATGSDIVIALGNGKGQFSQGASMTVGADKQPGYVAVGDLNGDKKPDIVSSNYSAGTVAILLAK